MLALVRALLSGFSRLISSRAGHWVAAALATIGLQFAVYEIGIQPFLDYMTNHLDTAPAALIEWLGFAWVDRGLSLILSAIAAAFGLNAAKRVFLAKRPA